MLKVERPDGEGTVISGLSNQRRLNGLHSSWTTNAERATYYDKSLTAPSRKTSRQEPPSSLTCFKGEMVIHGYLLEFCWKFARRHWSGDDASGPIGMVGTWTSASSLLALTTSLKCRPSIIIRRPSVPILHPETTQCKLSTFTFDRAHKIQTFG